MSTMLAQTHYTCMAPAIGFEQDFQTSWDLGIEDECKIAAPSQSQDYPSKHCYVLSEVYSREGWLQSTLFCIFNHCYFISSPSKLKTCHAIKQLYIHDIMQKYENNAFQKKFYNQFKQGTFSVECAPCIWAIKSWQVNKKLGCMHCIMFTWYPM